MLCNVVPVNIKHSKCFLLDKTMLPHDGDFKSDEMPWRCRKGKSVKEYHVQYNDLGEVISSWPKSQGIISNRSTKVVKMTRSNWFHANVKEASKTVIEVEGNPVVLIQYKGLSNQDGLTLGKRHTRPSTVKRIQKELNNTSCNKRVRFNVHSKLTQSKDLEGPSAIPTARTVSNQKSKESSKEKKSTMTEVFHEMAESTYVRTYNVTSNIVSVVLFDDAQLADIDRFCSHDCFPVSPLYVDTTFKFGKFYVVTTSYRHLFLRSKASGNCPTMIGPTMITHNLKRSTYRVLFDSVTQERPHLKESLKCFVTDGEEALSQALSESFPHAAGLLCLTHIERNVRAYIKEKLKLSEQFYNTVLADIRGNLSHKGLIHCKDYTEYTDCLTVILDKWDKLELAEFPHKDPRFSVYFKKTKHQDIYSHCRVQLFEDIGVVDKYPDNNPPESTHATMRRWQGFKQQSLPAFIKDMEGLKDAQQKDVTAAFQGTESPYSVRDEYDTYRIPADLMYGESRNSDEVRKRLCTISKLKVVASNQEAFNKETQLTSVSDKTAPATPTASFAIKHDISTLINIPVEIRKVIVDRAQVLDGRIGFEENTYMFRKGKKTCLTTTSHRGRYTCECHTFSAYNICQHVLYHADQDNRVKELVAHVKRKKSQPDLIANYNRNPMAGSKGNESRMRKGRINDDSRPSLKEVLPASTASRPSVVVPATATASASTQSSSTSSRPSVVVPATASTSTQPSYVSTLLGNNVIQFSLRDNGSGVIRRPDKPSIPPTLGMPFIVKRVERNISSCFGCGGSLKMASVCVAHEQRDLFWNGNTKRWQNTRPGSRKHFHLNETCIKSGNNPGFMEDMLVKEVKY